MQDRVTRRKWATFSRALHGRARQAVAPTEKKQKRLQKNKTNAGSRHAAQMGHIFAGVTRAGEASRRPYGEKTTAKAAENGNSNGGGDFKFEISDFR